MGRRQDLPAVSGENCPICQEAVIGPPRPGRGVGLCARVHARRVHCVHGRGHRKGSAALPSMPRWPSSRNTSASAAGGDGGDRDGGRGPPGGRGAASTSGSRSDRPRAALGSNVEAMRSAEVAPKWMMPPRRWQRLYHQVPHAAEDDDQSTSPKTRAGQLDYPTSIEHPRHLPRGRRLPGHPMNVMFKLQTGPVDHRRTITAALSVHGRVSDSPYRTSHKIPSPPLPPLPRVCMRFPHSEVSPTR